MEPTAKRARLSGFLALPINHSRLAECLRVVRADPRLLDVPMSKLDLDRAANEIYNQVGDNLVLRRDDGSEFWLACRFLGQEFETFR